MLDPQSKRIAAEADVAQAHVWPTPSSVRGD